MLNTAQVQAVALARQIIANQPLFLDTETTGLGWQDEVIEIGIVNSDGAVLFNSLVRPFGKISFGALAVHGIKQSMLNNAPLWSEVWPSVEPLLAGRLIGVYNDDFDLRMMKQSHRRSGMAWRIKEENFFCIMKLYARFRGEWDYRKRDYRWHSLAKAIRESSIPQIQSHRAADDALLARALLHYIAG